MKIKTKDKRVWYSTKKRKQRTIVYGVHPKDARRPRKEYAFWCSDYLYIMNVQPEDLVIVSGRRGNSVLYVTRIEPWKKGDFEPTGMARHFYEGEGYKDFKIE